MADAAGSLGHLVKTLSRSYSKFGTVPIPVSPPLPKKIDMNARAHMRLICLLTALLVSPAAALDVKYTPSTWEDWKAEALMWATPTGTLVAVYESDSDDNQPGAGRTVIGYDVATEAWFHIVRSRVVGVDPQGRAFAGEPHRGSVAYVEPTPDLSLLYITGYAPGVYRQWFLADQSRAAHVERGSDQSWRLTFAGGGPDPSNPRMAAIVFDPAGIPRTFWAAADPGTGRTQVEYDYLIDARSPSGLHLVSRSNRSSYRLASVEHHPKGNPAIFDIESIEQIAVDNRMAIEMKLLAGPGNPASGFPTTPAQYEQTKIARVSWPLIMTGIAVIAIGVFAIIRARAAR